MYSTQITTPVTGSLKVFNVQKENHCNGLTVFCLSANQNGSVLRFHAHIFKTKMQIALELDKLWQYIVTKACICTTAPCTWVKSTKQ